MATVVGVAGILATLSALLVPGTAAGAPTPAATPGSAARGATAAPFGEGAQALRFDVERITPDLVTADGLQTVSISGLVTNTSDLPLTDLEYRFQRGAALEDTAALAEELATPSQPSEVVELTFRPLATQLAPGASLRFAVTAPVGTGSGGGAGLQVTEPGVYPLMLNVNATLPASSGIGRARAGELHTLLPVASTPAGPTDGTDPTGTTDQLTATPVTLFVPLADTVHLGVGGVFLNDDLATDIRAGGRLATLVDQLATLPYPEAVDLLVDPMLLDELTAMAAGYRVVADVGAPQPPLPLPLPQETAPGTSGATVATTPIPPSTDPSADAAAPATTAGATSPATTTAVQPTPPGTIAGTGGPDAAAFLVKLQQLAQRYRITVLPYSDPDVVAMTRADLRVEVRTSVRRGIAVARQVLGDGVVTTVAVPPHGDLDGATAAVLAEAGYRTLVLSELTVAADEQLGVATVTLPEDVGGGSLPALIGDSPVLDAVTAVVDGERGQNTALALNALAGTLVQQSVDGGGVPVAHLPQADAAQYRMSGGADPTAARRMNAMLGRLAAGGVVRPGDPSTLASMADAVTTLDYGLQRADELPASYLARWVETSAEVSGVSATLQVAAEGPAVPPAELIGELRDAMRPLGSASLRADQQPGDLILDTVDSTLVQLRDGVAIRSTAGSYTLASGSAPLVLTVRNDLPYDVTVRVRIEGAARVGMTVEDPGVVRVPARRSQQVPLPVTVNRSGTFTVDAVLIGADGQQWGAPVQLRIRSTAYGAITVVVIAVAGAALLLMVVWRIAQRIRQRGKGSTDPDGDGSGHEQQEPAPDSITAAANHPPPLGPPVPEQEPEPVPEPTAGAGRP